MLNAMMCMFINTCKVLWCLHVSHLVNVWMFIYELVIGFLSGFTIY